MSDTENNDTVKSREFDDVGIWDTSEANDIFYLVAKYCPQCTWLVLDEDPAGHCGVPWRCVLSYLPGLTFDKLTEIFRDENWGRLYRFGWLFRPDIKLARPDGSHPVFVWVDWRGFPPAEQPGKGRHHKLLLKYDQICRYHHVRRIISERRHNAPI
jgi:hypothetical protein